MMVELQGPRGPIYINPANVICIDGVWPEGAAVRVLGKSMLVMLGGAMLPVTGDPKTVAEELSAIQRPGPQSLWPASKGN